MIKVIAFDLVGVLVRENDFALTPEEEKLERMFGPNINDEEFLLTAGKIIPNNAQLIETAKHIVENIYDIREENLLKNIKENFPEVKIVIATNHVSYIKNFIIKNFETKYLDDIFISAIINKIKPNEDFYEHILHKFNISSQELLFLDDNLENIDGAKSLDINTIKVEKNTNIYSSVIEFLE